MATVLWPDSPETSTLLRISMNCEVEGLAAEEVVVTLLCEVSVTTLLRVCFGDSFATSGGDETALV